MNRTSSRDPLVASDRLFSCLLRAYPDEFRREYGIEMAQLFRDCCRAAYAGQGWWGILCLWPRTLGDLALTALEERTKESGVKTLSSQDLQRHITILGWLYLLGYALFLLIAAGIYVYTVLLSGSGAPVGEAEAVGVLGLLTLLALPGMFAGYGFLQRKRWGRMLALVVAFFQLQSFPIGTAFGLYTFWVLLQESAADYFAPGISTNV